MVRRSKPLKKIPYGKKKLPADLLDVVAKHSKGREASILRSMGARARRARKGEGKRIKVEADMFGGRGISTNPFYSGPNLSGHAHPNINQIFDDHRLRVRESAANIGLGNSGDLRGYFGSCKAPRLREVPYGLRDDEARQKTANVQHFWKGVYNNPIVQAGLGAAKAYAGLSGLPFGKSNVCR